MKKKNNQNPSNNKASNNNINQFNMGMQSKKPIKIVMDDDKLGKSVCINASNFVKTQISHKSKIINKGKKHIKGNSFQNEIQKKEEELKKLKKESELEDQIIDRLKCYICLEQVIKPKMCSYCKRMCCDECIKQWLAAHHTCGICKHYTCYQEMIDIPFIDQMSSYFINRIDKNNIKDIIPLKQKKIKELKEDQKDNISNDYFSINNIEPNIQDNNIIDLDDQILGDEDKDITSGNVCDKHKEKVEFYCVQCKDYYCGKCLNIFSSEASNHRDHLILKAKNLENQNMNSLLQEYTQLSKTKDYINKMLSLINLKIKENEMEKYQVNKILNHIANSYNKVIDEENLTEKELQDTIKIYNYEKNSLAKKISDSLNSKNNLGKEGLKKELNNILHFENNLIEDIKNKYINKSNIDFQTYHFGYTTKINLNQYDPLICDFVIYNFQRSNITVKNLNNKIYFIIEIEQDKKEINRAKFYSFIIFKTKNNGIEYLNLYEKGNSIDAIYFPRYKPSQINHAAIDYDKFNFLLKEDNNLSMRIHIAKVLYR